ncbi:MAG TPA: histidine kinase [Steroidobacteraceae bacterium]|jgi:hypothetical protein
MNAISPEHAVAAPRSVFAGRIGRLRESVDTRLGARPMLVILTVFWIYVALSNVLYANSMQASFSYMTGKVFFAPWDARLLQHLFLYPLLLLAVWASQQTGWQPRLRAIPLQLLIAFLFCIPAAPLLTLGEWLTHEAMMQAQTQAHLPHAWPVHTWWKDFFADDELPMWSASAISFFLTYGFGIALINGFSLYQRYRDSQLRSAALERALTGAHLAALRMQLSPHTLFNLLHTIRGQISWDPVAAQSMVVQLGDLLRRLLTAGEREFSRLTDEFQFVRLYLELQQKRFADRLTVWITDVDTLPSLWVPSLILQPLVENAVVHGLARHTGAVVIRVEAATEQQTLVLRVVNTVAREPVVGQESIGLRNVRDRLRLQFGENATFTAGEAEEGIWVAEVRIPMLSDVRRQP